MAVHPLAPPVTLIGLDLQVEGDVEAGDQGGCNGHYN